jgi:hypothetical protein
MGTKVAVKHESSSSVDRFINVFQGLIEKHQFCRDTGGTNYLLLIFHK